MQEIENIIKCLTDENDDNGKTVTKLSEAIAAANAYKKYCVFSQIALKRTANNAK